MASKTTRAKATPKAAAGSVSTDAALSLSQDQLQAVIGLTDVMFKGVEEMRRCQMEAAHQARERHEQAQAQVAKASTPTELFELQSELLRFDLEASSRCWQQLAAICAETQANTMSLFNRSAATVSGDLAKLIAQPEPPAAAKPSPKEAAAPGHGDAANQAWNQWVDLGKQWTDLVYRAEAALH
jgi:phasin family protein